MSDNEFERAVSFLQGAPDAALTEETNASAKGQSAGDPCLPGFEQDREAAEPMSTADGRPALRRDIRRRPAATGASAQGGLGARIRRCDIGRFACFAGIVALAAIAVITAVRLIKPRTIVREVVQEIRTEPDGIPLALLPSTADADAWNIVANMSGTLGGTPLVFRRGIARVNGIDYKVCLDFCRNGGDVYVRIAGPSSWILRVRPDGKIIRAYPAPKNNRPLKALFAR